MKAILSLPTYYVQSDIISMADYLLLLNICVDYKKKQVHSQQYSLLFGITELLWFSETCDNLDTTV